MALEVRVTPGKGIGVYAARPYSIFEVVLEFAGPLLKRAELPFHIPDEEDHYLQISPDEYLGPSGKADDYVNHSCAPNCGVHMMMTRIPLLVALGDIQAGEEITFDYSTTSTETPATWAMICHCGTPACRGIISGFALLSKPEQSRYIELGIVPRFVHAH